MRAPLDKKKVAEAREMRKAGLSYVQIASRLGVSANCVHKYCVDVQVDVPNAPHCPKCGQVLPVGAKFCYMCGIRIFTDREKIILDLERMRNFAMLIPETSRDFAMEVINKAVAYLKRLED